MILADDPKRVKHSEGGIVIKVRAKLSDIIDAMDIQMDESLSYVDKETGEVLNFTHEELVAAEDDEPLDDFPDWQRESIQKAIKIIYEDNAPSLPTKWDIHEYRIMENFCYSIEDKRISDSLFRAIRGTGAFRYFKDTVYRFGIQDDWYKYRYEAFKEIAIRWCEGNNIEYIDDTEKPLSADEG